MSAFLSSPSFAPLATSPYSSTQFFGKRCAHSLPQPQPQPISHPHIPTTIVAIKLPNLPKVNVPNVKLPNIKLPGNIGGAFANAFKNEFTAKPASRQITSPKKPGDDDTEDGSDTSGDGQTSRDARLRAKAAPAEISVGGRKVKMMAVDPTGVASSRFIKNRGVQAGIPGKAERKFYNPTSSRYYYRRAGLGQGYTAFDVRIGEKGAKPTNMRDNDQGTFRNMDLYTRPLVWTKTGWAPVESRVGVQRVYRQLFGNAYLWESDLENLKYSESCVKNNGNIKEFVRAVGLSELYKRKFYETSSQMRFIEVNFKHFLGRQPRSQQEIKLHVNILAREGYNAEINSYVDSEEYDSLWGLSRVPDVNFRGGHNTNQEMNKLAVVNGTPSQSDAVRKKQYFSTGSNDIGMKASAVYNGLPSDWKGENAARDAAEPVMEYSLDKFWNTLPYGMKDDMRNWTSRYGTWNKFWYKDSVVFKDMITPRLKVTEEEAKEADAILKYGSLMADRYLGVRKVFDVAPVIDIKKPRGEEETGGGGFVSLAMKEITTSIPASLQQKV